MEHVNEMSEPLVAIIELVVAGHEGVEADVGHDVGVRLPLVEGVVHSSGDGVPSMNFEDVGLRLCCLFEQRH